VKAAHGGLPRRLYETMSAFANHPNGGVIILGLDEEQDFTTVGISNPQQRLAELGDMASQMIPPLRLSPIMINVNDAPIMVVEVPECDYRRKPCYFGPAGLNSGTYIRVGNSNRRMTDYEIFTYVSAHGESTYDKEPVRTATPEDLDEEKVKHYLSQIKREQPRLWRRLRLDEKSFHEQLLALSLVVQTQEDLRPTLAGLLVFGVWPQQHFPSLMITFVHYPGTEPGTKGPRRERFLDNRKFEGCLDEIVDDAVQRVVVSMRHGTLIEGVFHRTVLEYPEEAVREAGQSHLDHAEKNRI
jgi:ATP-dependent DNA helicase RecG